MTVYPEQPGSEAKLVLEAIHDLAAATEGDPFARQKLVEGWDQERLRRARVMVVGAGALGNEVLKNLALLGIGSIFIVDFDRIAISNLSRSVLFRESDSGRSKAEVAAERTKTLCLEPTATVCYFSGNLVHDLGTGVYRRIDVVIGCLDNLEARMSISRNCWLVGSPWVDGGMHGWDGRISIFCPGQTACYLCTLGEVGLRDIRRRYSCDQRRHRLIAENKMPAIQSTSAIVAAIQVQEALRLL
jgi:adenylyltransferase/sulfurtransferase